MNQKDFLDYQGILNHLKKENLRPIYLFFGKEDYLKESTLNKFKDKVIPSNQRELNYKVFYGGKNSLTEIMKEIEIIPFMAKYKLIVLKEAENIDKTERVKLIDYLNHWHLTNNFSFLIIIYKENIPDKELIAAVKRIGLIVKLDIPDKSELTLWIKVKFRRSNKKITPEALYYLQSLVDTTDLRYLFNEIEKIDVYTKDKELVEKEDVITTISGSEAINIFQVLDYLGEKKLPQALDGLVKLDQGNLPYLSILAMIYRQIRLILQTKLLLLEGANLTKIREELKLPVFVIEKLERQARNYTIQELCQAYKLLNIADLELKDNQKNPQIVLEELVINIINEGNK